MEYFDETSNWLDKPLFHLLNIENAPEIVINPRLDLENQRTINIDAERTKPDVLTSDETFELQQILTFYCKEEKILYKQGMNEIMAPFIISCRFGVALSQAYFCFKKLISLCLPTMFEDTTFRPIQGLFVILKLLMKYHTPEIFTFFTKKEITPEVFATSWFLTLFSSKIQNIEILFSLWESIIIEKDMFFPCFFALALLDYNKTEILKSDEFMPKIISKFQIESYDCLNILLEKARNMKRYMPRSMRIRLKKYNIYKLESINQLVRKLSRSPSLPVLPKEVVLRTYPQEFVCKCQNNTCSWCTHQDPDPPLIILDCRSPNEQSFGCLPNTALIDPQFWEDATSIENIVNQYSNEKGVFHISLLGSQFFWEKSREGEETDNSTKMIKNLFQNFTEKGFPYISIIEGGYKSCHEAIIRRSLSLQSHNISLCKECIILNSSSERSSTKLKELKEKIIGNVQSQVKDSLVSQRRISREESIKIFNDLKSTAEKIQIDLSLKHYECKKYNKTLGSCYPEEYILLLDSDYLILATPLNEETGIVVEKNHIKDLQKITSIKNSPKTLTFSFFEQRKKSFTMRSKKEAKACIKQLTGVYNLYKQTKNVG